MTNWNRTIPGACLLAALVLFGTRGPAGGTSSAVAASEDVPVPTAAAIPYVDTHVHFEAKILSTPEAETDNALQEMAKENAQKFIFFPGPLLPEDPNRFDYETFQAAVKKHPDKLAFLGGGGTLNVMIQESVRSGKTDSALEKKFKERAEQILRDGAVGFGEMSAEHLSVNPGQAYETAPPDHPLYLLLAEIAAAHGVPIDLHMDVIPQTMKLPEFLKSPPNPPEIREDISGFERLLNHNKRARIVWAHAGNDSTGYRTPEFCRQMLSAHPNLFMEIKIDPLEIGKNPPLADGKIKPEWLKLFSDFPDRFVLGSDQHYVSGRTMTGPQRWSMDVLLLNQLPAGLQVKIGRENALRIFSVTH